MTSTPIQDFSHQQSQEGERVTKLGAKSIVFVAQRLGFSKCKCSSQSFLSLTLI